MWNDSKLQRDARNFSRGFQLRSDQIALASSYNPQPAQKVLGENGFSLSKDARGLHLPEWSS